ncbi:MBL fold metallo-hydrolase [Clostridium baratii]|uniref:Metallo-beta-lactamase domain protein n=1 Tax=Clostridium baratii TaxID=1561 RepID=A0A174VAT8_9CLOT|nr:MBL fold metallo-hydrolase [Clostridium baratii]CUQ31722.1 metallo-beta-lactamase domain protein [Clostridium baratii]
MNFFKNIQFLTRLTYNNLREYFKDREASDKDEIYEDSINWYGHATTIMNLSGKLIVTDPVVSNTLGYFKRVIDKPYDITKIKFDYILLSHGHMDHMHFPSLKKLRKLNKDTKIIVPRGYKKILSLLGFTNVHLIRTGESYVDEDIKITSIEANHDGRRFYVGIDNESHSYLIERNDKVIFFGGDTAYTENFKDIECDVALMPVGCYKPARFQHMHCSPEEGYKMFKMMNSKIMIPIHYKTFKISLEDFAETHETLVNFRDDSVKILNVGQTYKL